MTGGQSQTATLSTLKGFARDPRLWKYARFMRAYEGYAVRGTVGNTALQEWKRLKYNFCRPIVNVGAQWLVGGPAIWDIKTSDAAVDAATAIWERSGSDGAFIKAALLGAIYGDAVALATIDDKKLARIQFIDPSVCNPVFNSHNASLLDSVGIAYDMLGKAGDRVMYEEEWRPDGYYIKDSSETDTYHKVTDYSPWGGELPVSWITNQGMLGRAFGFSDLENVVELVEEYDHLCSKRTRVVDYYASPNLYIKGVTKSDFTKDETTVIFLPKDGDIGFVEWQGNAPDLGEQLISIRETISEISETPAIAFGKIDSGFASATGVSLKVLYGPLMTKTMRKRASWVPALERAMRLALHSEGIICDQHDVRLILPDPSPSNSLEETQELVMEKSIGASNSILLAKKGYTSEEIRDMKTEADAEQSQVANMAMKQFDAGGKGSVD